MSFAQGPEGQQNNENPFKVQESMIVTKTQVESENQGESLILRQRTEQQIIQSQKSIIQQNNDPFSNSQRVPEGEGLIIQTESAIVKDIPLPKGQVPKLPPHTHMDSLGEFIDLINKRFVDVRRHSTIYKYYAKILFQALVYLSTVLELLFTLLYAKENEIHKVQMYAGLYFFSISLTLLLHIYIWIYTYRYMKVQRNHICWDILNYILYTIIGILSYLKILPFLMFYFRDTSIQQFSFSQINKYLIMTSDDRQGNPSGLFKKRKKPVNIFRDLIFHRIALISMMITFLTQTLPMLFIQGFFNGYEKEWNDFNNFTYFLLIANIAYYLTELQFIVFTTTYRQILVDIQEKLHKIGIQKIQETKQLLKADESYLEDVKSFYFQIDASKLNDYEKRRCIIQIIKFILNLRNLKLIVFSSIDQYEIVTLEYLANALKFLEIDKIKLCYKYESNLEQLKVIFQDFQNLSLVQEDDVNLGVEWDNDKQEEIQGEIKRKTVQVKTKRTSNVISQITGSRNRAVSTSFFLLTPDQMRSSINNHDSINRSLSRGPQEQLQKLKTLLKQQDSLEQIKSQSEEEIGQITKFALLQEQLGCMRRLAGCYDYYEQIKTMNVFQGVLQSLISLLNLTFQIMQYVYFVQVTKDRLIWALIILQILNPILQLISFAMFYIKVFRTSTLYQLITATILFFIFNLLKIWDLVMKIVFLCFRELIEPIQRNLSLNVQAYIRFKSYAAKFKGTIAIVVFTYFSASVDPNSLWEISRSPIYQAILWRTSVDEALNKIPQFFIYILTEEKDYAWGFSIVSSIKDGILAVKDLLSVVIKDFFVPALILRKVSVEQFFSSMSYMSSIQDSILLEYPKSFAIISKLDKQQINLRKYRIDFTNLDFSYFEPLRKKKLQAQLRLVLVNITSSIEILKAQEFLYFGDELISIMNCFKVSELQELKLNFHLDEIGQTDFKLLDVIIANCPRSRLSLLEIHVESRKAVNLSFKVERQQTLKGFSYSYYQIREMLNSRKISNSEIIQLDVQFLQLDRYNFKEFYLEVGGQMDLSKCQTFFNQFKELETLEIKLQSDTREQSFNLKNNIISPKLNSLELNLENIQLITQGFDLSKLRYFKLTLINCKFDKKDLERLLITIQYNGRIVLNLRQASVKDNERQNMERSIMKSQNDEQKLNNQEMLRISKALEKKNARINFIL